MYQDFLELLLSHESYLVVTHVRPDGDGIGSQIALGGFLRTQGKRVILAGSDDTPANLFFLDPERQIQIFDGSPLQLVKFGETDAVILVDANTPKRVGQKR